MSSSENFQTIEKREERWNNVGKIAVIFPRNFFCVGQKKRKKCGLVLSKHFFVLSTNNSLGCRQKATSYQQQLLRDTPQKFYSFLTKYILYFFW